MYVGQVVQGLSVAAFCDNMAALQGAVNGASTAVDLCALSHMLAIRTTRLGVQLWIEYVNTISNPAEGGSRVGVDCELARACLVSLRMVMCPFLSASFPLLHADECFHTPVQASLRACIIIIPSGSCMQKELCRISSWARYAVGSAQ